MRIKRNLTFYTHILSRIFDLYKNLVESEIGYLFENLKNYVRFFDNFKRFSKYDLGHFSDLTWDKPGWAYLDFKGNFSKKNKKSQKIFTRINS